MSVAHLSGPMFLLKSLLFSVIKISNLMTLLYRILTIIMIILHYTLIERVDYMNQALRQNEYSFIILILGWHLIFMNLKISEESRRAKNQQHKMIINVVTGIFAVPAVLVVLSTPILSWFNFSCTQLDNSYFTQRYFMLFLYIITSIFPHVTNFLFFLSDGVILSQLTSLYLYNEFSMSALLTILPVLFVLHNHLLVKGIQNFVKDEHKNKMTFVRLIGRHDAVFLFVIYSVFTTIFGIVDIFASNWFFAANTWYILYALYAFAKLMDHK